MSIADKQSRTSSFDHNNINEAALQNPELLNNPTLHHRIRQYNFYNLLFLLLSLGQLCYEIANDFDTIRNYNQSLGKVSSLGAETLRTNYNDQ